MNYEMQSAKRECRPGKGLKTQQGVARQQTPKGRAGRVALPGRQRHQKDALFLAATAILMSSRQLGGCAGPRKGQSRVYMRRSVRFSPLRSDRTSIVDGDTDNTWSVSFFASSGRGTLEVV